MRRRTDNEVWAVSHREGVWSGKGKSWSMWWLLFSTTFNGGPGHGQHSVHCVADLIDGLTTIHKNFRVLLNRSDECPRDKLSAALPPPPLTLKWAERPTNQRRTWWWRHRTCNRFVSIYGCGFARSKLVGKFIWVEQKKVGDSPIGDLKFINHLDPQFGKWIGFCCGGGC